MPFSTEMTNGPMLPALLGERLRLKFHRETREVQKCSLTVAKSGLKLQPEGVALPWIYRKPHRRQPRNLGVAQPRGNKLRASSRLTCPWGPMTQFAQALGLSGRMVID